MQNKPAAPKINFSIAPEASGHAVCANGKVMLTPGKHSFVLPAQALAKAICKEWETSPKFTPASHPLTSLAYTAIDRIAGQEEAIIEALLVYVDTDTLSYRDTGENKLLAERQKKEWDPVLEWVGAVIGARFEVTQGIMPIDQPPEVQAGFRKVFEKLDIMRLSAASVLASCCSSMILALAVAKGHMDGEKAFQLSRLEEDTQAEAWGRDPEAESRALRLKNDILAASHFLRLLEAA
jgi:chaperone required for assembly of F1-ATPase